MKANQFVQNDDAVSPVIAVILMVAITVVLAATVYLWVSGFGSNQATLVQASFGAKAVDLPWASTDTDTGDDAIQLIYVSGQEDLVATDVIISIDGVALNWSTAVRNFIDPNGMTAGDFCTSSPGGDADDTWERGGSLYLIDTAGGATDATECDGTVSALGDLASLKGVHQLTVSVKGQVVLDTTVEVHDDATLN